MISNPLKRPILKILEKSMQNSPGALKEYELHSLFRGTAYAELIKDCSDELSLFRKHFLIMNALYELHEELLDQGLYLQISALNIQLQEQSEDSIAKQQLSTHTGFQKLSLYYRDWKNFNNTNEDDVTELLRQFWTKYLAHEEKFNSLKCLELKKNALWPEIQQQYRRLCLQHHPDKGGESLRFIQIRQAYDNLKQLYIQSP